MGLRFKGFGMKKNCNNCEYLEWGFGDMNDPEGFCCLKRYYNSPEEENKHLEQLENPDYREAAKKCCELVENKREHI